MKKPEEIKRDLLNATVKFCRDLYAYIKRLEEEKAALLEALRNTDQDCEYCKHAKVYGQFCEEYGFSCSDCKVLDQCPCYKCTRQNKQWEWCGLPDDAGGEAHGRS